MKTIYLDNNATTAVRPEVLQKMLPFFCERYGNPSSIHSFGGSVAGEIEEARRQCAELLGARWEGELENIIGLPVVKLKEVLEKYALTTPAG